VDGSAGSYSLGDTAGGGGVNGVPAIVVRSFSVAGDSEVRSKFVGIGWFFWPRRKKKTARPTIRARPTTPPTTPPAIAPTFVPPDLEAGLLVLVGFVRDVAVGAAVDSAP